MDQVKARIHGSSCDVVLGSSHKLRPAVEGLTWRDYGKFCLEPQDTCKFKVGKKEARPACVEALAPLV